MSAVEIAEFMKVNVIGTGQVSVSVKAWLEATRKGIEWASQNPEAAVTLFEETYPEAATDNGYNLEAWKATIPLLTVDGGYPAQTDEEWSSFTQALVEAGQLDQALTPGEYYTNDYAPPS